MLLSTTLSLFTAAALAAQDAPATVVARPEPIALTVEYVGDPATPRGAAFMEFLTDNFTGVEMTDADVLADPADAVERFANADVLLVDANLTGKLPDGYGKPMIVLGGQGVLTAASLGAKLDWL